MYLLYTEILSIIVYIVYISTKIIRKTEQYTIN